jgi:5-methylcytosine-specific restriction endonuclease McrA
MKARTLADILPGTLVEAEQVRRATPKHATTPRVVERIAYKAKREKSEAAFRAAVWKRDGSQCRLCGRKVTRSVDSTVRGHVHHVRGRNVAPEDRYNPKAALLVCALCHLKLHAGQQVKP